MAWAFASVAVVSLLAVGLVLTFISYNAQIEQIAIRQQKTADGAAVLTSDYLRRARDTLWIHGQTASGFGLMLRSYENQQQELASILDTYGIMFQSVTLLDEEGMELAKVSSFEDSDIQDLGSQPDLEAFQQALEGQSYIDTQTSLHPAASFPSVLMAVPIRPREGGVRRGVLLADVSLGGMWDAVAEVEVGETGYAYIIDRQTGELIVHSDPERSATLEGQLLTHVPLVDQLLSGVESLRGQYTGVNGEQVIGAASGLGDANWVMVVELPTREALTGVRRMLMLLGVLLVLGTGAAIILGLLVPQRIVEPLIALQKGAQEIGRGHLDRVIEVDTGDEIQDLAEAFNQMASNLGASQAALERWGQELEATVEARTAELAATSQRMQRRAEQLEGSSEVARAIASVRDLDVLLPQVTRSTSERFGWYHCGIFLLDEAGKFAVLRAANSTGGQRMLARGHRLRVGKEGIVGYSTGSGEPRVALDVGLDAVYFDNPDLPETRSEIALPLAVGGRIIGAIDIQSREPAAFDEEDVTLLRILADQVAIAIDNSRLFEQAQAALEEVRAVHRQYLQQEWARVTAGGRSLSYEYRRTGVSDQEEGWVLEESPALMEGRLVSLPARTGDGGRDDDGHGDSGSALAAPIRLRDQVIGVLDLVETDEHREWTEDEVALVQAISDQVGLALENARLFADTQRRAEQMAAINRIGLSINSDLDLKGVLNALYEHVQRVLDAHAFYVALYDSATGIVDFPLLVNQGQVIDLEPQYLDEAAGVTGHVIQSRRTLHIPDLQSLDEGTPYEVITDEEEPTRSYVGVPLLSRDRVIGVLSVQNSQPNAYGQEDIELLETIATQASTAIENARAYERLAETAEELREIDRFKTQFLANMSHELRTPLNSIIGFSRVMLKGIDGPLTEHQQADLQSINNSGQHLLALINSILDMSKIEAGKMELSMAEVLLPDILSAVLSTSKALVKDQPIELRSEVPEVLPTVWADAQRVRQILLNLMSNAAKFTEAGSITLRVEPGSEFITISVTDTGVGIDPDAQTRLFIPFQQVDGSTTRRAGGTGLGLAISRSFVEMHGGEIWVESEPGQGTTFAFTLPIYEIVKQREGKESEFQLDPTRKVVLAIDDDPGVITLLRRYVEQEGYQVIGVTDPLHAIQQAEKLAPHLTAITLDVVMPNADGWKLLRALKENRHTQDIPIIVCSIVEDIQQGLEMGAEFCLRKPITRQEMLDALKKLERPVVPTLKK